MKVATDSYDPRVILALASFFLLGILIGGAFAGAINWKMLFDVFTAVGTVAATVVAVWFGVGNERRYRSEATDRVALYAASLTPTLEKALERARRCTAIFDFPNATTPEDNIPAQIRERTARVIQAVDAMHDLSFAVSVEQLAPVAGLPKRAAMRVSFALGLIGALRKEIMETTETKRWKAGDLAVKDDFIATWSGEMSRICSYLGVAMREFRDAAMQGAPEPTDEEEHGDALL